MCSTPSGSVFCSRASMLVWRSALQPYTILLDGPVPLTDSGGTPGVFTFTLDFVSPGNPMLVCDRSTTSPGAGTAYCRWRVFTVSFITSEVTGRSTFFGIIITPPLSCVPFAGLICAGETDMLGAVTHPADSRSTRRQRLSRWCHFFFCLFPLPRPLLPRRAQCTA